MCFTTRLTCFYVQTPSKMAAGPTGPMAVSRNGNHPPAPRRARAYAKSNGKVGGRKADCWVGSFERSLVSSQVTTLQTRESSLRATYSQLERPLPSNVFWARPHDLVSRTNLRTRAVFFHSVTHQLGPGIAHQLVTRNIVENRIATMLDAPTKGGRMSNVKRSPELPRNRG